MMWQAEETVLGECAEPEDFHGKFSVWRLPEHAGMKNPDAGNDVGRVRRVPAKRVFGFDEQMILAFIVADVMGLQGITRQSVIVESGMPTAIFGVVLAQEFDTAPDLVTVVITLSSLASILTLTVLLAIT